MYECMHTWDVQSTRVHSMYCMFSKQQQCVGLPRFLRIFVRGLNFENVLYVNVYNDNEWFDVGPAREMMHTKEDRNHFRDSYLHIFPRGCRWRTELLSSMSYADEILMPFNRILYEAELLRATVLLSPCQVILYHLDSTSSPAICSVHANLGWPSSQRSKRRLDNP